MRKLSHLVAMVMLPLSLALTGCSDDADVDAEDVDGEVDESSDAVTGEGYAERILRHSARIHLTTVHTSGVRDNADAKQNIIDTASGRNAATSRYGDAGGRRVQIKYAVLKSMVRLSSRFTYTVTEIAGGDHSSGSLHYSGRAIDVGSINGQRVGSGAPHGAFMRMCRSLGADEVLGPGDADHSTHVHCGWR